jgi:hypothetical protein
MIAGPLVNAEPGEIPTFPFIVVVPVLVTVCPANIAKSSAVPILMGASAAILIDGGIITTSNVRTNNI